jgi:hypothetical protein
MRYVIGIALFIVFSCTLLARGENFILTYTYSVMTSDSDAMIDVLRKLARDQGGYVKFFSRDKVIIRLPREQIERIRGYLSQAGFIADERRAQSDVSETLLDLQTKLTVKKQFLEKLYAIFKSSQFTQTLAVEREVGKAIMEIEKIKGQIAYYQDRVSLTEITVIINERSGSKKRQMSTQWDWIRKLGIEKLLMDF